MKLVIAGGAGQVGTILARTFHDDGHEVVVLSRKPLERPWRVVRWDGESPGGWCSELEGCDAVINLAGRSVNCRYTAANRHEILQSRVVSTRLVGEAIASASPPPPVWLQASTATIYAHRFDHPNDEHSGLIGGDEPDAPDTWRFSIDVARAWERAFNTIALPHTRKVAMRSAMTLSPDGGGVFDTLARLARRGLGGRAGDGRQFISWVHERDFVEAVRWLIQHEAIEGVVNIASPNPLPNAEFMRVLRQACDAPAGLPSAKWMLEVGAFLMQTETELILKSRRVVPARLLENGFRFQYPEWSSAARELCARWKCWPGAGHRSAGSKGTRPTTHAA